MKTRNGFVSNSSSTSFCIVGTSGFAKKVFRAVVEKSQMSISGIEDVFSSGVGEVDGITFVGNPSYENNTLDEAIESMELSYCGFEAKGILEKHSLADAREIVCNKFKQLGVDVPVNKINLLYGEASNE
jgi:hypothetical protein